MIKSMLARLLAPYNGLGAKYYPLISYHIMNSCHPDGVNSLIALPITQGPREAHLPGLKSYPMATSMRAA